LFLVFDDLDLIGEAENRKLALDLCQQNTPDVILMDIVMPVMDSILATRAIHKQYPQVKIVMMTSYTEDYFVKNHLKQVRLDLYS
jgi:YesN/AraC family two-component response regulator